MTSEQLTVIKPPLSFYVDKLKAGTPFAFVRYGDGEWISMLGGKGQTCDGHEYFDEMASDLRHSLTINDPNFIRSIGPLALQDGRKAQITRYLYQKKLSLEWHSTEVFLQASLAGKLFPLVEQLHQKRVVYAGPAHLELFCWRDLAVNDFIPVPTQNAYLSMNEMVTRVSLAIERQRAELLAVSAGPAAKVLIAKLWPKFGRTVTMLDLGSVWDGYVGRVSRSHVKRLTPTAVAQNLGVRV